MEGEGVGEGSLKDFRGLRQNVGWTNLSEGAVLRRRLRQGRGNRRTQDGENEDLKPIKMQPNMCNRRTFP